METMSTPEDLADFLRTRRDRITPVQAGLPDLLGTRRVPGLRREEVASLAGISVEYYTRLERGRPGRISDDVLEAVSVALQLTEDEHEHLFRLVRAVAPVSRAARRREVARSARSQAIRPFVQRILDALDTPAFLRNSRFDIVAANRMGRALYQPVYASPTAQDGFPNSARFAFLDEAAREFFVDLAQVRDDCVAYLHAEAARSPYDSGLSGLIGELSTRSEPFRVLWAAQEVRVHRTGIKRLRHPVVGMLILDFEALDLSADQGLRLNVYTVAPDSPSAEALGLLDSWTGTQSVVI